MVAEGKTPEPSPPKSRARAPRPAPTEELGKERRTSRSRGTPRKGRAPKAPPKGATTAQPEDERTIDFIREPEAITGLRPGTAKASTKAKPVSEPIVDLVNEREEQRQIAMAKPTASRHSNKPSSGMAAVVAGEIRSQREASRQNMGAVKHSSVIDHPHTRVVIERVPKITKVGDFAVPMLRWQSGSRQAYARAIFMAAISALVPTCIVFGLMFLASEFGLAKGNDGRAAFGPLISYPLYVLAFIAFIWSAEGMKHGAARLLGSSLLSARIACYLVDGIAAGLQILRVYAGQLGAGASVIAVVESTAVDIYLYLAMFLSWFCYFLYRQEAERKYPFVQQRIADTMGYELYAPDPHALTHDDSKR